MLPALAQTYGIRPWELCELTVDELAVFQRHLRLQHDS